MVSLVSPRRTFAAVQATTKTRVDLGLRLDQVSPAGRLQPAKNIASGTINLRIALTGPDEVDEEVLGWLKRTYDQSVAPAAPRRPARLVDVEPGLIEAGMRPGSLLTARVRLTDSQRNPICARLRPPNIA